MRKIVLVLASVSLALGVIYFGFNASSIPDIDEAQAQTVTTASAQPNIVFILTDDMRKDDLQYLPQTKELLQSRASPSRTPSSRTHFAALPGPLS